MEFNEAKAQFIQTWGKLGSEWGINRTMAQVHAILLISPKPLCTEDIMEELNISRGNTNMNVRDLMNWELAYKKLIPAPPCTVLKLYISLVISSLRSIYIFILIYLDQSIYSTTQHEHL